MSVLAPRRTRATTRRARTPWGLLVIPGFALLAVFFFYPLGLIAHQSFTETVAPNRGAFGNYTWFFDSSVNVRVLLRTFRTAVVVTSLCLLLAYPYAYLMTVVGWRWRLAMMGAVIVPFCTGSMVQIFAWWVLLQDHGVINDAIAALGGSRIAFVGTLKAVTIAEVAIVLSVMILPLYASLASIDRRYLDAASSLGDTRWGAFWRVYFPLSVPGVLAGAVLVFVLSLGYYLQPAVLGSPQQSLLSQIIVVQVNELLAFGRGGAIGIVLLALTLVLLGVVGRFGRRVGWIERIG